MPNIAKGVFTYRSSSTGGTVTLDSGEWKDRTVSVQTKKYTKTIRGRNGPAFTGVKLDSLPGVGTEVIVNVRPDASDDRRIEACEWGPAVH